MPHDSHLAGGSLLMNAGVWTAMMGAMMGPTVAPWVLAYHRVIGRPRAAVSRTAGTTVFAGGYMIVWLVFGVVAAALSAALPSGAVLLGPLLVVAGLFQLTPLKRACLTHCRSPLGFLLTRWRDGRLPALRIGLAHGVYCLGCCWALMLTMTAVGMANLAWMAALTVMVFVEQVAPGGDRLRVPLAVALVAAGAWIW